jgi:hypothetical protein
VAWDRRHCHPGSGRCQQQGAGLRGVERS